VVAARIQQSKPIHVRVYKASALEQHEALPMAPKKVEVPSGDDWMNTSLLRQAAQAAVAHATDAMSSAAKIVMGLKQGEHVPQMIAVSPEDAEHMTFNACWKDEKDESSECASNKFNAFKLKSVTPLKTTEVKRSETPTTVPTNVVQAQDQGNLDLVSSASQRSADRSDEGQGKIHCCHSEERQSGYETQGFASTSPYTPVHYVSRRG
jgi:hypothetical protein